MYGIIVFGDSIAFGRGDSYKGGWCGRLKQFFEKKASHNCLFNLSICGDTSTKLLDRFDVELSHRAKYIREGDKNILILAIGINDSRLLLDISKEETTLLEFEKNINILIDKSKKSVDEVFIINLIPVDEKITIDFEKTQFTNKRINEFNNILKKVSEEKEVYFIDIYNYFINLNYTNLLFDGLHPNSDGYDLMFEKIKDFLESKNVF